MPEADVFEAPQGATFHGELTTAITEAFVGNGVLADGDAYVQADSNTAMGTVVTAADTGIAYGGDTYTPASASFTHSNGPTTTTNGQNDRRVDIIYFDESTGGYAKSEGTADPNPTPPSIPSDALLLAVVLVAHGATDLQDADILNWRARPVSGITSGSGRAEFRQGVHVGWQDTNPSTTSTPKSFTFTAGDGRDVHSQTDVTISNSSGASATETVTVELYDGVDTTGTLIDSQSQSVTVANGATKTVTFLTTDHNLDGGDYHINITQSGTDLTFDKTEEVTVGLEWSFTETDAGTLQLTNQYSGSVVLDVDPMTDELGLLAGAIDTAEIASNAVTDTEIGTLSAGVTGAQDAGLFGSLFDFPVSSTPTAGTEQSYTFDIDATTIFKPYAEADGAGGIQNARAQIHAPLYDAVNAVTAYDTVDGHVPRPQVDDERVTKTVSGNYTTSGEEVIMVDTSAVTSGVTITLASGDVAAGNFVAVVDIGGSAASYAITVNTEGTETIDGASSKTVRQNYGATVVASDGANWFTSGGSGGVELEDDGSTVVPGATAISTGAGLSATDDTDGTGTIDYEHTEVFEGRESGSVSAGNQGVLIMDNLAAGETAEVYKAVLVNADGTAVPSSVDLELVTFDNAGAFTSQSVLINSDGATVYDDVTGAPLGSYTNSGTSAQTIGVIVDNGGTSAVTIIASVEGVTGL